MSADEAKDVDMEDANEEAVVEEVRDPSGEGRTETENGGKSGRHRVTLGFHHPSGVRARVPHALFFIMSLYSSPPQEATGVGGGKCKLVPRFEIKKWNAVAMWSWDICADTASRLWSSFDRRACVRACRGRRALCVRAGVRACVRAGDARCVCACVGVCVC